MSNFYRLDISALSKILSERGTDWQVSKATILQAAVRVAFRYMAEWKHECDIITTRKHQIAVFNGKNYGKLPEGSKINLKNDVLSINGRQAAARE